MLLWTQQKQWPWILLLIFIHHPQPTLKKKRHQIFTEAPDQEFPTVCSANFSEQIARTVLLSYSLLLLHGYLLHIFCGSKCLSKLDKMFIEVS